MQGHTRPVPISGVKAELGERSMSSEQVPSTEVLALLSSGTDVPVFRVVPRSLRHRPIAHGASTSATIAATFLAQFGLGPDPKETFSQIRVAVRSLGRRMSRRLS